MPSASSAFLLNERAKELNCLYRVSRAFDKGRGDVPCALQLAAEALPPAWQHPDVAAARVVYGDVEYKTPGFRITSWLQECPLLVDGCVAGSVTVSYLEERPECDEGPFLLEERTLLNALAQRIAIFIEGELARTKLLEYQEDLRFLASELAVSEQRERRRLAEMLHDRIGQNLAVVALKLAQVRQAAAHDGQIRLLDELQKLVQDVIAETRVLTYDLCPPILYELGLEPALEWLAENTQERFGVEVRVRVRGAVDPLEEELRVALFSWARELLANVGKHAHAAVAELVVCADGEEIQLSVQDNGVGMSDLAADGASARRSGFGLFNVRERLSRLGGEMRVSSRPGYGTLVVLALPRPSLGSTASAASGDARPGGRMLAHSG